MSNIETQILRLLDEAAIRDVTARFADAACVRTMILFVQCGQ